MRKMDKAVQRESDHLLDDYRYGQLFPALDRGLKALENTKLDREERCSILLTTADTAFGLTDYWFAAELLTDQSSYIRQLRPGLRGRHVHTRSKCYYEQAFLRSREMWKWLERSEELLKKAEALYNRDKTFPNRKFFIGIVHFRQSLIALAKL